VGTDKAANGVIITQGGQFGGWSLYAKMESSSIVITCWACSASTPPQTPYCRLASTRCAWNLPTKAAWDVGVPLPCFGWQQDRGEVRRRDQPMFYSLDETTGRRLRNTGTMVAEDYTAGTSKFNGRIEWVQLDQGADDYDHMISPEERWHVAMTRSKNSILGVPSTPSGRLT